MSFCYKVVSFPFFGVNQRAREGKYEVRDLLATAVNKSPAVLFHAHSTTSKEKIVCSETRIWLENWSVLVYVNHSVCVGGQQSSNFNKLKGMK